MTQNQSTMRPLLTRLRDRPKDHLLLHEAADEIERLTAALAACQTYDYRALVEEIERLREALAMLYDKWENGDGCYEDPEAHDGYMGNAFKLSDAEENQVLALIPRERGASETGVKP